MCAYLPQDSRAHLPRRTLVRVQPSLTHNFTHVAQHIRRATLVTTMASDARASEDPLTLRLETTLESRRQRNLLRSLVYDTTSSPLTLIDFSSNDYLGLARSEELQRLVQTSTNATGLGATGSRLLTGDSPAAQALERKLASFHASESALLFNTGFDANVSLMSCLPQPQSVVLFDELVHASCRDGIKTCRARIAKHFKHNDVKDLMSEMNQLGKDELVFIVVESVYSMDGHLAPLKELCDIVKARRGTYLIVDEAHGTGTYGKGGRGLVQHLGLENYVYARVHTFGKAVGYHGAVVIGPKVLRSYLINYARPLIFSTSMPAHSIVAISCAYDYMECVAEERQVLLEVLATRFCETSKALKLKVVDSPSPIQAIVVPGNENVVRVSRALREKGFGVLPIRAPTVPEGEERIRVVLHSYNSIKEVDDLLDAVVLTLRELKM